MRRKENQLGKGGEQSWRDPEGQRGSIFQLGRRERSLRGEKFSLLISASRCQFSLLKIHNG